jgi:hypothetical protein
MAKSRTAAQNATATAVRSGKTFVKNIRVGQRTTDAPRLFLQLFNNNAPTVGTTAPEIVVPVPAGNGNLDQQALDVQLWGKFGGAYFDTGLAYAVTTTHDGSTNPDAGDEPEVIVDYEPLG